MDLSTISTGNAKLDHLLGLLGVVVTLASTAAGFVNAKIRAALDAGESDIPWPFLALGLTLNTLAFNVDKASQLRRMMRGAPVTVLKVGGVAPAATATPSTPPADPPPGA